MFTTYKGRPAYIRRQFLYTQAEFAAEQERAKQINEEAQKHEEVRQANNITADSHTKPIHYTTI